MKKFLSLFLCLFFISTLIPFEATGATNIPTVITAPKDVAVSVSPDGDRIWNYDIGLTIPSDVLLFSGNNYQEWLDAGLMSELAVVGEFDYKYNESGNWHYDASWDTATIAPDPFNYGYLVNFSNQFPNDIMYINAETLSPRVNSMSMLNENTLFFRIRFRVRYFDGNGDYVQLISPWSETVAIGKNAEEEEINLVAPILTKAELKQESSTQLPYIEVTNNVPAGILAVDNTAGTVKIGVEVRIDGGAWKAQTGFSMLSTMFTINPDSVGMGNETEIKAGKYELRARFAYDAPDGDPNVDQWSPYSNILTIDMPYFYSGASGWAVPEMNEAANLGIIPDSIKDKLSSPITREEFAEVAVKFYELITGNKAEPHPTKTFKDTNNPEILKAYNLKITYGAGDGTIFEPKNILIRQQMAVMITRTLKACDPDFIIDAAGQPDFLDQKDFLGSFIPSAKFMAKYKITVGDGKGHFNPNENCSREQAIAFLVRSYSFLTGDL